MAGADRAQAQHLTFLTNAAAQTKFFGLFPLVRGAEARALELPRVGTSKRPEQNIGPHGATANTSQRVCLL
jgi:hypothetical protein